MKTTHIDGLPGLTLQGVKGPTEALEGQNGWFHAVTEQFDEAMLLGSDHLLLHDSIHNI